MKSQTPWHHPKRWGSAVVVWALMAQMVMPAHAFVSQLPGVYTTPPDVNVMFTLDDSGSMYSEAIPDYASNLTPNLKNDGPSAALPGLGGPNGNGTAFPALWFERKNSLGDVREIFIEVPADTGGVSVAKDEEAKKQIEAIRARALKGEDFGKLATEVSTSPSKANGGLIGPFSHADMSPQLLAVVEKMKQGDITPPIRTPKGYQLFKLEVLKAQALQPFNSVSDLVSEKLSGSRTQAEMRKFLTRLRSQAIIEWKNDELKKVYQKFVNTTEPVVSGQ